METIETSLTITLIIVNMILMDTHKEVLHLYPSIYKSLIINDGRE